MPTIIKNTTREWYNSGPLREQLSRRNSKDRNTPITADHRDINGVTSRPHRLMKTSSKQSKRRDLHLIVRQTIIHLLLLYLPR